jgi:hypothetical protein
MQGGDVRSVMRGGREVHAPHRSSPTLTQSLSVPAPRSTPTVHSHHRPSPLRLFTTHHVHRYGPPVTSLRHTTLSLSAPHGPTPQPCTPLGTTSPHCLSTQTTSTYNPLLTGTLSTISLLLTSHTLSQQQLAPHKPLSQHDLLLTDLQLHNTLSPGSSPPFLHKPLEIKLDLLLRTKLNLSLSIILN